jgi:DNA-binding response OmpR family regulator
MPMRKPVKSVLIVEDNEVAIEALTKAIKLHPVEVKVARSVKEAILLVPECPEIVLLDLVLPDGLGLEFLEKLRQSGCLSRVVVMTGLDSGDVLVSKIWQYSVETILPKPVTLHSLFFLLGL